MVKELNILNQEISNSMSIKITNTPKEIPKFKEGIRRAPKRESKLSKSDIKLALKNALR